MLVRAIQQTPSLEANDGTEIREILHPHNEGLELAYSLAHATLPPGATSKPHRLEGRSEVYVLQRGRGTVWIDGASRQLETGELVFIPPGAVQYIRNDSADAPLEFLCIVSPPYAREKDHLVGPPTY